MGCLFFGRGRTVLELPSSFWVVVNVFGGGGGWDKQVPWHSRKQHLTVL